MSRKELREHYIKELEKGIYHLYPFTETIIDYDGYNTVTTEVNFYYKGEHLRLQRKIYEPSLVDYGEEIVKNEMLTIQRTITEKMLEIEVRENDTSTEKK